MPTYATESFISRLYTSRRTLLNLLQRQGFKADEYQEFSMNELHIMKEKDQLDMLLTKPDGQKAYVKYHIAKALRPSHIYDYVEDLFRIEEMLTGRDQLIIVIKDNVNDSIISVLREVYDDDKSFVNVFSLGKLLFNVLDHSLVPPHRIMTDEEVKILEELKCITNKKQYPEISRFDPVAEAIGLRPEDVCEITRSSKTAITTKYYRYCL
jgi:DNA-directed RNA polymerase subunit H (RpoH/RPB5)